MADRHSSYFYKYLSTQRIIKWIDLGLEFLWLFAVVFVPIAFVDKAYFHGEAAISHLEVPKTTVLRTLAALMGALWLIEWVLKDTVQLIPNWMRYLIKLISDFD